jgi:hypothetical protein
LRDGIYPGQASGNDKQSLKHEPSYPRIATTVMPGLVPGIPAVKLLQSQKSPRPQHFLA